MTKTENRKNWMEWLTAAGILCLLALLYLVFRFPGEKADPYDIVILGDSIIANAGSVYGDGVDVYLEEQTGARVLRGAFGGSRVSYSNQASMPLASHDQLCLVRLAEALCNRDFGAQHAQINNGIRYINANNQTGEYFPEVLSSLAALDLRDTAYLIIEHGTNDYNSGCPLDNPDDPKDVATFGGGLRYAIEKLQKAYPQLQIVLMTPMWCSFWRDEAWHDCTTEDFGYGTLEDYVETELSIAGEYGLPVIDVFHDSPIGQATRESYLTDGLHVNPEGQRVLAEMIAGKIRELEEGGDA